MPTSPLPPAHLPDLQTKADIETVADIEAIVRVFYLDIQTDPLLGRYFSGLDMDAHVENLAQFWSGIVFHTGSYRGRPFDPHARLEGLTRDHFAGWLDRFHTVVDTHFQGVRATLMKDRATQIAGIFQVKLGLWGVLGST